MPLTIHGSLLARLDQLGSAREVAKIAAVIGRDFSIGLLASVTGQAESNASGGPPASKIRADPAQRT